LVFLGLDFWFFKGSDSIFLDKDWIGLFVFPVPVFSFFIFFFSFVCCYSLLLIQRCKTYLSYAYFLDKANNTVGELTDFPDKAFNGYNDEFGEGGVLINNILVYN
jgi:hypothetical protein